MGLQEEASGEPSRQFYTHGVDLVLRQTRVGTLSVVALCTLLGVMLVPSAGWSRFLVWYVLVLLAFVGRHWLFDLIVARYPEPKQALPKLSSIAAVSGWVASLAVPLFAPFLNGSELGLLTVIMFGWIAAAVTVLAITPTIYAVYAFACTATVVIGWAQRVPWFEVVIFAVASTLALVVLIQLAKQINRLIRESVSYSLKNQELVASLSLALEETKSAQKARSRFLAAASHDLLQPVHSLKLLMDVMRHTTNPVMKNNVEQQIGRAVTSIDGMFRSLLDLAQIDAGTIKVSKQSVSLAALIESSLAGFDMRSQANGLTWHAHCDPSIFVQSDPVLLGRIIRNLAENSLKFTTQGRISLSVATTAQTAELSVEDTGVGIPEDELSQIFQPFFRGVASKITEADGVGLGLAIIDHMARLLDIKVTIESTPKVGTKVTISVPLGEQSAQEIGSHLQVSVNLHGLAVLVVDDDVVVRNSTRLWCEHQGAQCVSAATLQDALNRIEESGKAPQLLLIDFRLADGITGPDVIHGVRQKYGKIPALIISGERAINDTELGFPIVKKPIQSDELARTIRQVLTT